MFMLVALAIQEKLLVALTVVVAVKATMVAVVVLIFVLDKIVCMLV